MRKLLFLFAYACSLSLYAQIPASYYDAAVGKSGYELKSVLSNIIDNHTVLTYGSDNPGGLWHAFRTTDVRPDGTVWDMYSNCTFYPWTDGHIAGKGECVGGTQQEHTFCQSWMNYSSTPLYSDLFHLYPVDAWVNGRRSNYPYGEVPNWDGWVQRSFQNGARLGYNSFVASDFSSYCDKAYEPIDEYKGDIARGFFYIATRYMFEDSEFSTTHAMTYRSQLRPWALAMLKKWNQQDPVSQKEIDRNNSIYSLFQHNRNPYIDYPALVDLVFGDDSAEVAFHPQMCLSPEDLTVNAHALQPLSVNVTWTNPSHLLNGEPCADVQCIVVTRNNLVVHTVLNPVRGQRMSWMDKTIPASGYYDYKVFAVNTVGRGMTARARVFAGQDCPIKVELFNASYEEWKGGRLEFYDDDDNLFVSVSRHCGEDTCNMHYFSMPIGQIHGVWVPGENDNEVSFRVIDHDGNPIFVSHCQLASDQSGYHSEVENAAGEIFTFQNSSCGADSQPCRVVDTVLFSINAHDLPYYYAPGNITIVDGLSDASYCFLRPGSNGCDTVVVLKCSVVGGVEAQQDFACSVYPNPTSGNVMVESNVPIQAVSLCGVNGCLLQTIDGKHEKTVCIDLSSYQNGLYHIRVRLADGKEAVRKVIKTN